MLVIASEAKQSLEFSSKSTDCSIPTSGKIYLGKKFIAPYKQVNFSLPFLMIILD